MFIRELATAGAIPALEFTARFAAQRQRIISHNISNIDTPEFQPLDADVGEFQKTLGEAVDRRRKQWGGERGALEWRESRALQQDDFGRLQVRARQVSDGVLYHDRNNRDLEKQMQDLVENVATFRMATDLLKSRYDMLRTAIVGRL